MLGKNYLQEMPASSKGPLIIAETNKGVLSNARDYSFPKVLYLEREEKITDQSNFVNDVT